MSEGVFRSLLFDVYLADLSSLAMIWLQKRDLVALLKWCLCCYMEVCVLCRFLAVPLIVLLSLIVVLPSQTHVFFSIVLRVLQEDIYGMLGDLEHNCHTGH